MICSREPSIQELFLDDYIMNFHPSKSSSLWVICSRKSVI
jgi:hypothetical protein